MRDIILFAFVMAVLGMGLRRPFLFVLAYAYIDILSPQRFSYRLLNQIPISLICFVLAFSAWLFFDDKKGTRVAPRQVLMAILLLYCGLTTMSADFPVEALEKWAWVWKSLVFAVFLPLTLRTRLRIETLTLFMTLSAGTIIILGGIKTIISGGGGYGVLNLLVTNNSGIYESSTIAMVAIALIPIILFLMKHNSFFPKDWRAKTFCIALCFACLLIPIGTQARTGLICMGVLFVMSLRQAKRPFLYLGTIAALALVTVPFLPKAFTDRMSTISDNKGDSSAGTRLAVWRWTWEFAKDNPLGGGFESYRQNQVRYEAVKTETTGSQTSATTRVVQDEGRAFHSSYFEMLGEQGYPGVIMWLLIHIIGLIRMELLQRKFRKRAVEDGQWIGDLADALQKAHVIYLIGSLFVGIAFQSFVYMLVGLQIGLDIYAKKMGVGAADGPFGKSKPTAQPFNVKAPLKAV
jgi:probable O-glycosylation ligase (exosortase A-associated)